jgi:hypothetical protein
MDAKIPIPSAHPARIPWPGPLDGKERCYEVSGRKVWLHPECYRFFVRVMP